MANKSTSISVQDSLNLNSDYNVWGHMLDEMCHTPVRDMDGLEQRLIDMWSGLQQSVINQWCKQLRVCVYESRCKALLHLF